MMPIELNARSERARQREQLRRAMRKAAFVFGEGHSELAIADREAALDDGEVANGIAANTCVTSSEPTRAPGG